MTVAAAASVVSARPNETDASRKQRGSNLILGFGA